MLQFWHFRTLLFSQLIFNAHYQSLCRRRLITYRTRTATFFFVNSASLIHYKTRTFFVVLQFYYICYANHLPWVYDIIFHMFLFRVQNVTFASICQQFLESSSHPFSSTFTLDLFHFFVTYRWLLFVFFFHFVSTSALLLFVAIFSKDNSKAL